MSNIKEVRYNPKLGQPISWGMAAMLRDVAAAVVVRTRLRAIPLAKMTMREAIHGFL